MMSEYLFAMRCARGKAIERMGCKLTLMIPDGTRVVEVAASKPNAPPSMPPLMLHAKSYDASRARISPVYASPIAKT